MASEVTVAARGPTLPASPTSSANPAIEKLLATQQLWGPDGYFEGSWDVPAAVPDELLPALRDELPAARELLRPATKAQLAPWLGTLALLCAGGGMTGEDARVKLEAYSAMMLGRVAASVLTRQNLDEIARKYRFLPTYGELIADLEALAAPAEKRHGRIAALLGLSEGSRFEAFMLAFERSKAAGYRVPYPTAEMFSLPAREAARLERLSKLGEEQKRLGLR